jgi:hypothetical protein
MSHLIREQYLHVEFDGTETEGLALQRRLSGLCRHHLLPAMERTLDRHSPAEGDLYIQRLEVDAGALDLERLEEELAESVARALDESLREELPSACSSSTHKSSQQSIEEAFVYFLKTGTLPWSFRLPSDGDLEETLLDSWREADGSGTGTGAAHLELLQTLCMPAARDRLIRQFSTFFLETLLAILSPTGMPMVKEILRTFRSVVMPSSVMELFRRTIWEAAFAGAAAGKPLTEEYFLNETRRADALSGTGNNYQALELERQRKGTVDAVTVSGEISRGSELPSPVTESLHPELLPDEPLKASKSVAATSNGEHPEAQAGMYIENAGLVLLHPFLPRLFETLKIASQEKLLQPERALCLLHYLSNGQLIAPEYQLILPKILCNVDLPTPVESDVDLTDTEQREAEELLQAVIGHWGALRNTSADGLRGTFLLRNGKLSMRGDGDWLLQVESETCDILLGQLPWGISMIKLPWMDRMLWVEWS